MELLVFNINVPFHFVVICAIILCIPSVFGYIIADAIIAQLRIEEIIEIYYETNNISIKYSKFKNTVAPNMHLLSKKQLAQISKDGDLAKFYSEYKDLHDRLLEIKNMQTSDTLIGSLSVFDLNRNLIAIYNQMGQILFMQCDFVKSKEYFMRGHLLIKETRKISDIDFNLYAQSIHGLIYAMHCLKENYSEHVDEFVNFLYINNLKDNLLESFREQIDAVKGCRCC